MIHHYGGEANLCAPQTFSFKGKYPYKPRSINVISVIRLYTINVKIKFKIKTILVNPVNPFKDYWEA